MISVDLKCRRANVLLREDHPNGVFIVLIATKNITANLAYRRDYADMSVNVDAVSVPAIREEFRGYLPGVIAAVLGALPAESHQDIEPVGGACYLLESGSRKPICALSIRMGSPTVSLPAVLTPSSALVRSAALLSTHPRRSRVATLLLSATLEEEVVARFMLSWTALEMFVHTVFGERYEAAAVAARTASNSALAKAISPLVFPVRAKFVAIVFALSDRAMEEMMRDPWLNLAKRFGVRVFSEANWGLFTAWLGSLDANLSDEHIHDLAMAYPDSVANPLDVMRAQVAEYDFRKCLH